MAISLKTAGTWAEYTTDLQTVAIPGSPAAGDRMFLWVQWKDQGITLATPGGWNLVANSNFSDGTTGSGNGTGSIRQSVFYRDWQSGDAAPTLDFSTATGLLAEAVVMLWQKGAGDLWDAPSAVSAAWPSSGGPQTVSASSATAVPDGAVVMAGVGIRDDSATFTRGTTDIDVASGITWNGNYVESPATHYSTTTGNDHSGDLGHRFVTTGNASVTLRCSVQALSAAETGSIVWVVQALAVNPAGTSAISLPVTTFAGTGAEEFTATGAMTLPAATVAGTGAEVFEATSAVTLPVLTVAGTGDHTESAPPTGTGAIVFPALTIAGSGSLILTATGAVTLPPLTVAASGTLILTGTAAIGLPALAVSATGIGGADDPVVGPFITGVNRRLLAEALRSAEEDHAAALLVDWL